MINLNIFYRLKKSTQGNFFQVGTHTINQKMFNYYYNNYN
jgi:hypothetical protein